MIQIKYDMKQSYVLRSKGSQCTIYILPREKRPLTIVSNPSRAMCPTITIYHMPHVSRCEFTHAATIVLGRCPWYPRLTLPTEGSNYPQKKAI